MMGILTTFAIFNVSLVVIIMLWCRIVVLRMARVGDTFFALCDDILLDKAV